MKGVASILFTAGLLSAPLGLSKDIQLTMAPQTDTTIVSGESRDTNYGGADMIMVLGGASPGKTESQGILIFDYSHAIGYSRFSKAELRLQMKPAPEAHTVELYGIDHKGVHDWNEAL